MKVARYEVPGTGTKDHFVPRDDRTLRKIKQLERSWLHADADRRSHRQKDFAVHMHWDIYIAKQREFLGAPYA